MQLVRGQVAVVTGAASGIGLAMAESFAELGLDVVLADIDEDHLSRAASRITDGGGSALPIRTDVRSVEQVNDLSVATLDHFGRVDVVANNAGVVAVGLTWEIEDSVWDWVLGVNLRGVINGLRAFVPHLISQNSGHVVNTASMAGISVMPGIAPYLASKHAVVALSEGLAAELAQAAPGVGVTVVCPGMVDTNILNSGRADAGERPTSGLAESAASAQAANVSGAGVISPREAAGEILAAIESNRLHVAPNGSFEGVRSWVDGILEDLRGLTP